MVLLAVGAVSIHSYAAGVQECVPTKTVAAARADYDAGIATISVTLNQAYAQALAQYNQATTNSLAAYNSTMKDAELQYQNEVAEIRTSLRLGWQQELEAAANRHNQTVAAASARYSSENQTALDSYNQSVSGAQASFNAGAKVLVDQYNAAVCAAK